MVDSNTLIDIVKKGRTNPDALQRFQIQYMESTVDGNVSMNSAGIPVVSVMEMNAVITAMQVRENVAQLSLIYPSLATNEEELSRHMSFKDHIGRWSFPSKAKFIIGLPLHEVIENAVLVPDGSGTRRLTIPGMTAITVSDTTFTMQYPIDILVMKHGAVTVNMDVTRLSPIYTPTSSRVEGVWINTVNNVEILYIPFDIYQMSVSHQSASITAIAGLREEYSFTDKFFMCRAYRKNISGNWEEIAVTYSDVTYDPTIPTVVASVDPQNKRVRIDVPQIYLSSGLVSGQIRIDIYTTKGELELALENLKSGSFSAKWEDPNITAGIDPLGYASRMGKFTSTFFGSDQTTYGGTGELSFNDLRNRVIMRSTRTEGPPTSDLQVSNNFRDSGFVKTTVIDNIGARRFLATAPLPKPRISTEAVATTDTLPFAVGTVGSVVVSKTITLNELTLADTVIDNGQRVTVLPSTLYNMVNGKIEIVPDSYVKTLKNTSITSLDQLTNIVNGNDYFYSPFFYVHDISSSEYQMRPYSLMNPKVVRKYAIHNNTTLGLTATVSEYSLELMPDFSGWRYIFAIGASSELNQLNPDQVKFQMSYFDEKANFRTIFNGTLLSPIDANTGKPVDNRYVFEVFIPTNWDVNKDDNIRIGTGTSMVPLLSSWDLVVILKDYMPVGAIKTDIETAYNPIQLPDYSPSSNYVGVVQEQLSINLGFHLDKLWKRTNSTVEPWMYERYTSDIPALYSRTVYETTPAGDPVMVMNADRTMLERKVLHAEGDPILDGNGKQVYSHYKDEIRKDPITKEPILVEGDRGILRHFDLVLLDGKYYFATADNVVSYRDQSVQRLVDWNNGVIANLAKQLIDQTNLYFHPKSSTGLVKAYVGDGDLISLEAAQKLSVEVTVPDHVYKNATLRRNLKVTIIQTIDTFLTTNETISQSELLNAVRDTIADDQIGISIRGLFNNQFEAITVAYSSVTPSIGKRLITDTALDLTIEDSIDIDFTRHRVGSLR